jgi:hypothetical protein
LSISISANRTVLLNTLAALGYDVQLDGETDIVLKAKKGMYCIRLRDHYPNIYRVVLPNFHEVTPGDELETAELYAQHMNDRIKVAKIVISRDSMQCSAVADLFCINATAFVAVLERTLYVLLDAGAEFYRDVQDVDLAALLSEPGLN